MGRLQPTRRLRRRSLFLLAVIMGGLMPAVALVVKPLHAEATATYASTIVGDSPSIYYRLGESSGTTATDSSGNGYDGTYTAHATLGVGGGITSDSNTAISNDGITSAVNYTGGSGLPTGNSSRSAELWFNSSAAPTASSQVIEWGKAGTDTGYGLSFYRTTSIEVDDWLNGYSVTSPRTIFDGNWHYLAATYDGTTSNIYLDGALIDSRAFGHTMATTSDGLALGANAPNGGQAYPGSLDEAAIYSSVLTSAQIATHWRVGNAVACPTAPTDGYGKTVLADAPSRYYRLNEATGRAAVDYSGNCTVAAYTTQDVTYSAAGALIGNPDTAATFAGVHGSQVSETGSGLPSGNSSRSADLWFKSASGQIGSLVLFGWGTCCGDTGFGLSIHNQNQLEVDDWLHGVSFTAASSLLDDRWHYVAVTYDGTTATVYLDGAMLGSSAFGYTMATLAGPLALAANVGGGQTFPGSMDEVATYPTALSAARIRAHFMASGHVAPISPPVTPAESPTSQHFCWPCAVKHIAQGTMTPSPINTESGNFFHIFSDISIPGRSYPLSLVRTYNSQNASTSGPFGYGWTFNYAMSLSCSGTTATITQEDSGQVTFTKSGSCATGSWTPSATRTIATLVHNGGGTWTFERQGRDTYTFDSSGRLTTMTDANGYATSLAYTSGNLTTITDPSGRTLTLGWTGSNITSLTDANISPTRTVTYAYTSGNLTDVTDVAGGDTTFAYDGSHRITTMKDPGCQALGGACPGVQNHYDGSGRVDWQKDQLNRETSFSYAGSPGDDAGGTTTTTDPKGNVTVEGYEYGVRTYVTRGFGTASAATTRFSYDPTTLAPIAVMDPNGNATTQTVDSNGNVLTSTDPLGRVTTKTYNAFNEPLTIQDGKGVTTTMTYDGNGNLATTSTPASGSSCTCQVTTYNHADGTHPGDVTSIDDPDGKTASFVYDTYGNKVQTKDPLGHVTGSTYNADGWLTATYAPKAGCTWNSAPPAGCSATYKTSYSYIIPGGSTTDEFGDVQTTTDPLSHVTTVGYDADRNKTSVKDGEGNTTTYRFDVANELTTTTRPDAGATTQVTDYNSDGTVLDQKDGKGNAIQTYTYDALARPTTVTDALGNVTTVTYDANENVLTRQDPGGSCTGTVSKCTTMTYDAGNELKTVTYSDGVTPNITSVTYDGDGQRTAMADGTGTSSWAFDNLHRLTSYQNGNSQTVSYAYNLRNLVTTITYPGTHDVTRGYDDAGRLTSVQDWLGTPNTTSFGYDANSNLTSDTFQSGAVDTYTFDAGDQTMGISDVKTPLTIFSATYTRGSNGQLATDDSVPAAGGSYKYTALNQLCYGGSSNSSACASPPVGSTAYDFDTADNLTTNKGNAQQFNAADALCWTVTGASANTCGTAPTGATSYNYDTRGNRTSQVPAVGSATCNAFDQANRLTSIKTGTGSSCATPTTVGAYAYDGSGLRVSKAVSGTTTQFTWDPAGSLPLLLQDKAGAANPTSYIYGPGGLPVEQLDPAGAAHFYHHDQLGSTRAISSAAGVSEDTYTYDPYGNVTAATGTVTNPLQFSGEYQDAESGLAYLRTRYYDSVTAQFITSDPAVALTGSAYGYVAGDPLNATDPLGLWPWDNVCLRNPFGGDNDNGGCHTNLSTKQGTTAIAVTAAVGVTVASGGLAVEALTAGDGLTIAAFAGEEGEVAGTGATVLTGIGGVFAVGGAMVLGAAGAAECYNLMAEHTKNARPSQRDEHQQGQRRQGMDQGGERKNDPQKGWKQNPNKRNRPQDQ